MRARLVALLLAVAGCKKPPHPPKLEAIELHVRLLGPPALPVPTAAELEKIAAEVVNGVAGPMRYQPRAEPTTKLAVTMELGWEPGTLRAHVHAQLASRAEDAGVASVERDAMVDKEHAETMPSIADVRDHVRRALVLTVGATIAAEELWLGPPDKLRDALGGTDEDLRTDAITFVTERRDKLAVPALIELLKSPDEATRDRVVGALADLGDPRAVRPLADFAKFSEWDQLPKVIDAVSKIGGDEATSYLELLASGHQSPVIRDMAKAALIHMTRAPSASPQKPRAENREL